MLDPIRIHNVSMRKDRTNKKFNAHVQKNVRAYRHASYSDYMLSSGWIVKLLLRTCRQATKLERNVQTREGLFEKIRLPDQNKMIGVLDPQDFLQN